MTSVSQVTAKHPLTVCVDIDGTLLTYEDYEKNKWGQPIPHAMYVLNEWIENDVHVVLFTARGEDEKSALEKHLKDYKVPYDTLIMGKPHADFYVDDRAIKFTRWDEVLLEVKQRTDAFGKNGNITAGSNFLVLSGDPIKVMRDYDGIKIAVEWKKGETREYEDSPHKNLMHYDYGYIPLTMSEDGDELDVCLNIPPVKGAPVYMLMQMVKDSDEFDEYKFMMGFKSQEEAVAKYTQVMPKEFFGGIYTIPMDRFKEQFLPVYQGKLDQIEHDDPNDKSSDTAVDSGTDFSNQESTLHPIRPPEEEVDAAGPKSPKAIYTKDNRPPPPKAIYTKDNRPPPALVTQPAQVP